ncbi:hypothetical protein AMS68_001410 [Peltaster fructicola]|uniref:Dienelactone hydrolase domain-containing protein n=1 Tax=Peltaster fructicola TaxID=286661 RepID=A0A6H0XME6_9PEZI|nr:hypothetical protein AMS68_001410 [Peltaster fructicola]
MSSYSKACCTLPPAQAGDYTSKGSYETIGGLKTYVTGDKNVSKAIFWMADVFGFSSPTLQGADIIASAGYLVVIPDLLQGNYAKAAWFADTMSDSEQQEKGKFYGYIRDWPSRLQTVETSLAGLKAEYKGVQKWGSIGFCWGGKVAALTSGENAKWAVSIESSPAMVDPKDAEKIVIPHMMLASKDEPVAEVKQFKEALKTPHVVETFSDQVHGFMSARADFENPRTKEEFERGYKMAVGFFQEHL